MKNVQPLQYNQNRHSQKGNVLFIILVAVMLFAALGFAVSDILRSGDPRMIGEQRAQLFADELMDYSQNIRLAIQDMKISNGCSDTDISFTRTAGDAYEHSPAAPDTCKVFHPRGGGMTYVEPAEGSNDGSPWLFTGRYRIPGIGTGAETFSGAGPVTEQELLMILPGIADNICAQINLDADITTLPVDDGLTQTEFDGTYISVFGDAVISNTANPPLNLYKPFACISINNTSNIFYRVLIAR